VVPRPAPSSADEVERLTKTLSFVCDERDDLRKELDEQAATIASLRQQLAEATQYQEAWGRLKAHLENQSPSIPRSMMFAFADVVKHMDSLIPAAPAEAGKQQEDGQ
jgi:septal ring factor EnvC (AmiA/AmiB activator)